MLPKGYRDNRKHDAKTLRTRYTIDQDRQMDDQTHTATAPRSSLSPELPTAHTLEAAHTPFLSPFNKFLFPFAPL